MIVEKQVECRLSGETEVLGENLPQRHFCPSENPHMTRLGFEPGPPLTGFVTVERLTDLTLSTNKFWNTVNKLQTIID
jgi:hypothetical protein